MYMAGAPVPSVMALGVWLVMWRCVTVVSQELSRCSAKEAETKKLNENQTQHVVNQYLTQIDTSVLRDIQTYGVHSMPLKLRQRKPDPTDVIRAALLGMRCRKMITRQKEYAVAIILGALKGRWIRDEVREVHPVTEKMSVVDSKPSAAAAATATATAPAADPAPAPAPDPAPDPAVGMAAKSPPTAPAPSRSECTVCMDALASHILVPCGHQCVCEACINVGEECPVCREKVTFKTKVFRT